jgi:predicted Zn-dependent protease
MLHIAEGSPKEASGLLLEVAQHNALSSLAMALYFWSQYLSREYANVILQIEQAKASGQYGLVFDAVEALASIQLEDSDAQIERIEAMAADSPRDDVVLGALGYVYSTTGQRLRASEILDAMTYRETHEQGHEPYARAIILVGLNEPQRAVQLLEQSYREGSLWSLGFLSDPILDKLRDDPHYQLFLSKFSYPAHEDAFPRLGFVS